MSETDIRTLLATESYSPSMVAPLEAYLDAQSAGSAPYIFDAVRTLVKLYQLFPEYAKEDNIGRAYLLTLLEFPKTDHLALSYMIPHPILHKPVCSSIQTCLSQLSACQFPDFWKSYEALEGSAVAGPLAQRSVGRLQLSILQVLALTYQQAPGSVVCAALRGLSLTEVAALSSPVVERVENGTVVFRTSADNTKRETVYQEGVNFNAISSLLSKIAQ